MRNLGSVDKGIAIGAARLELTLTSSVAGSTFRKATGRKVLGITPII
jgi:hypothetical protein